MKLWKILVATMIALLLVCAVAMADETTAACAHNIVEIGREANGIVYQVPGDNEHYRLYDVTYGCNKCNDSATRYTVKNVQVAEYCVYNIKGETIAATCEEGQYTVYRCVCGAADKDYSTSWGPKGHDWNTNKKIFDGDCQTPTKWAKVCNTCGKQDGEAWTGNVGNHVWSESKLEATCEKDGWVFKTCTVKNCGATEDKVIKATGTHRWDYATSVIVASTCEEQGYSLVKCMDCEKVTAHDYQPVLGHDYKFHAAVEAKCNQVGNDSYWTCSRCPKIFKGTDATVVLSAIPYIPVNTNAHEIETGKWTYNITSCTSTNNSRTGTCIICKKTITESIPAAEHNFAAASELAGKAVGTHAGIGVVTEASNCTQTGKGYVVCKTCRAQTQLNVVIPAQGHKMPKTWSYQDPATCTKDMYAYRTCERTGCNHTEYELVAAATGHNWQVEKGSTTATCDKAGVCNRICSNCGIKENNVIVPATGHTYTEKVTAATCTKDGKVVKTCSVCGDKKTEKIPAAHGATKEVAGTAPSCGVAGSVDLICTVCGAKVGEKATAALSHAYSWIVVSKPSESGNGRNEYKCANCGDVAEVKTIRYSKYYYNNTMTAYGPTTKELVGGNDWYRVTPVDTSVDGVYTYDLIASNRYVVGKVTISVNAGVMTVNYKVAASHVDVKDASLLIYASKADLAAGTAVTANVGSAINLAETFGADSKVIVSLVLTGDYDAAGNNVTTMVANDAEIASMIANID